MSIKFIFKKTTELSFPEREQVRKLFFHVFGRERTEDSLQRAYLYSCKGYSYHGLMLHEDVIVGSFSAIPYRYKYFGRDMMFALSVDTMIAPEHRGGKSNLVTMANLVYEALIKNDIHFIYGFPNELYYSHEKRILKTRDIGSLSYYILPINIGAVFQKVRLLNPLSRLFARAAVSLPRIQRVRACKYNIEKVNDGVFEKHRYNDTHCNIELSDGAKCVYKICEEKHKVRTLYLIDVSPLTANSFGEAVRQVYRLAGRSADIIIYVGKLPFRPYGLIKLPKLLEPQKIRMTGKILSCDFLDNFLFALENWNVNISNFDVR